VHREVLEALPEGQRQAFTGALTSLVTGLLAEPGLRLRPGRLLTRTAATIAAHALLRVCLTHS
jgi:hypothetical protein